MIGNNETNDLNNICLVKLDNINHSIDNIKALVVIAIDSDLTEYNTAIQKSYWFIFEGVIHQAKKISAALQEDFSALSTSNTNLEPFLELQKVAEIIDICEVLIYMAKNFSDRSNFSELSVSYLHAIDYLLENAESSVKNIYQKVNRIM